MQQISSNLGFVRSSGLRKEFEPCISFVTQADVNRVFSFVDGHGSGCDFFLLRNLFAEEQIGVIELYLRRNPSGLPVMDTLNTAIFVQAKDLGDLRGPAERVNKYAIVCHGIHLRINTNRIKRHV